MGLNLRPRVGASGDSGKDSQSDRDGSCGTDKVSSRPSAEAVDGSRSRPSTASSDRTVSALSTQSSASASSAFGFPDSDGDGDGVGYFPKQISRPAYTFRKSTSVIPAFLFGKRIAIAIASSAGKQSQGRSSEAEETGDAIKMQRQQQRGKENTER